MNQVNQTAIIVEEVVKRLAGTVEEKHLPGQHDQAEHGREVRGAMRKMPTNWRQAKQMRDKVVEQLAQLSKAGLSADLKQRILAQTKRLTAPGAMNDLPKFAPQMRAAFALSKEADTYLATKEQRKKKPTQRLGEIIQEAEGDKVTSRLKQVVSEAGEKTELPQALKVAEQKPDYQAKMNKWLSAVGLKVAATAKAIKKYGTKWINAKIRSAQQRAEFKQQYRQWADAQSKVNKIHGEMTAEAGRSRGQTIPTRKFYEHAKQWQVEQTNANKFKDYFFKQANIPAEVQKALSDDTALILLESPYEAL